MPVASFWQPCILLKQTGWKLCAEHFAVNPLGTLKPFSLHVGQVLHVAADGLNIFGVEKHPACRSMQISELFEGHIAMYPCGVLIVLFPVHIGQPSFIVNNLQNGTLDDAWNVLELRQIKLPFKLQYGSKPEDLSGHSAIDPG